MRVIPDVLVTGLFLVLGNIMFRHFEPNMSPVRRVLKVLLILTATAIISWFFGRKGVIVAFAIALLPVIYVHAIWLPRHGVNGWTGEPREKYYALRGWPPAEH